MASYLLKPIQRMSKYALLLQELARACGGPAQELSALRAAQSLVHFQLRHGNDLLAMDAIQGCDVSLGRPWWPGGSGCEGRGQKRPGTHQAPTWQVNLKEQGQLVRQDEFTVRCGRHKSLRRIFLFEELLLFSKPHRGPTGIDMFTYKRSFKVGPTQPLPVPPAPLPYSLTELLSWPHRWQTLASLSAVGTTTCALRSGFAVARLGTPLCYKLPAWPPSRPGQLTSPACSGGRPSTTRVGVCPISSHDPLLGELTLSQRGPSEGLRNWKYWGGWKRSSSNSQHRRKNSSQAVLMSPSQAEDM